MAGRRKTNKKLGRGGRIALGCFAALLLGLLLLIGVGMVNANFVRLRRARVELPDLPESFDGTKILYASDIDLCGLNTADKSGKLFEQLQSLEPDLLLLGGDYTAFSLAEVLNNPGQRAVDSAETRRKRASFFHYISDFNAPLGKYAVAAPEDPDWDGLRQLMTDSGVQPLINDRVRLSRNGDSLWLAGISQETASLNSAGNAFSRDECVIVAAYSPEVLPILLTSEAKDGGNWADLALCGHTHGGQVNLFGRSLLDLSERGQRWRAGWYAENGLPILVNQGVGCEGLNLRLGTTPEVWLITLVRG